MPFVAARPVAALEVAAAAASSLAGPCVRGGGSLED